MTVFRQEKDRSSVGADSPVKPKNNIDGESLGNSDYSAHMQVQQDIRLWQAGYEAGLQDGLAQGPAHPAVQASVARMFGDWQGAEAARQQSTQRFRNWYRKERDAA
jgi:hypothetical protein